MGLNLARARFGDWLDDFGPESRTQYLKKLERHIGKKIDVNAWQLVDREYPRVGSYTTYEIFRLCLQYLTKGDYENDLEDDDDVEFEALREFRAQLQPAALKIPYAAHFLESGDTDTIFVPVLFAKPFVCDDRFVASLPGATKALEAFAKGLKFHLAAGGESENETENGKWQPVATAKNVARILYAFFTEKPNACVVLT